MVMPPPASPSDRCFSGCTSLQMVNNPSAQGQGSWQNPDDCLCTSGWSCCWCCSCTLCCAAVVPSWWFGCWCCCCRACRKRRSLCMSCSCSSLRSLNRCCCRCCCDVCFCGCCCLCCCCSDCFCCCLCVRCSLCFLHCCHFCCLCCSHFRLPSCYYFFNFGDILGHSSSLPSWFARCFLCAAEAFQSCLGFCCSWRRCCCLA
mmetsp:Transcript_57814/g.126698  ORF Transcript_57814/g.126698 Transcript_57814/m.126698 type:complete len:202 (+) Transcript_57814:529-1134(+)